MVSVDPLAAASQTGFMPLRVRCPTGHKLIVPDDRAGRSLRCPRCGQVTMVPGERREREQETGARSQEPVASAESTRRRDSSSVMDWPNSIAPPTAVATPELDPSAVDQVIASAVAPPPPIVEPPPAPVVKPKSRALPPRLPSRRRQNRRRLSSQNLLSPNRSSHRRLRLHQPARIAPAEVAAIVRGSRRLRQSRCQPLHRR